MVLHRNGMFIIYDRSVHFIQLTFTINLFVFLFYQLYKYFIDIRLGHHCRDMCCQNAVTYVLLMLSYDWHSYYISLSLSLLILYLLFKLTGRYPIHFHMCEDVDADEATRPWIKHNSIHHSNSRCVTIHGTHGLIVSIDIDYDRYKV